MMTRGLIALLIFSTQTWAQGTATPSEKKLYSADSAGYRVCIEERIVEEAKALNLNDLKVNNILLSRWSLSRLNGPMGGPDLSGFEFRATDSRKNAFEGFISIKAVDQYDVRTGEKVGMTCEIPTTDEIMCGVTAFQLNNKVRTIVKKVRPGCE